MSQAPFSIAQPQLQYLPQVQTNANPMQQLLKMILQHDPSSLFKNGSLPNMMPAFSHAQFPSDGSGGQPGWTNPDTGQSDWINPDTGGQANMIGMRTTADSPTFDGSSYPTLG